MRNILVGVALLVGCLTAFPAGQPAPSPLSDEQIEQFLRKAKIVRTRGIAKGVTGSTRATLTDGTITHDAQIQAIDETKREFRSDKGVEFNFRDNWRYNIAAYKIDRLLDLNMVPVSVERQWKSDPAAFTWWVDDVLMDELERYQKKVQAPNLACWNEQARLLRVFDQLIANTDRNLGNLLITKEWRLWAIDHTRAFRTGKQPNSMAALTKVDRGLLDRMAALDRETLRRETASYLSDYEIDALLARRDVIVEHFRKTGETAMFDREVAVPCTVQ